MNNPLIDLQKQGQNLWIDDISREMLHKRELQNYIDQYAVTGLTSNPTIFAKSLRQGEDYDDDVRKAAIKGESDEEIFFRLALSDLTSAADLFSPIFDKTNGEDGWVSLELSPVLALDARNSVLAAKALALRAAKKNLFIKIPGTTAGLSAIEETIFAGIPVNVTLLFSVKQYRAAADAWLRGIERRIAAGLDPDVPSVASLFVSRWDVAIRSMPAAAEIYNQLGIAVAEETYRSYRGLQETKRWQDIKTKGARMQKLLFASTSVKDPSVKDTLYVSALAAPGTINTMPSGTLKAFADHGKVDGVISMDSHKSVQVLEAAQRFVDIDALGERLQVEGTKSFADSWNELLAGIAAKADRSRPQLAKGVLR
jgi:transaldolase